jgi:TetR/AcrR family transcriptional regulator
MARPRAADHAAKRAAIRDAAAALFAEQGFDGSSMAELAHSCGVTKASLYHYYASKEDVLFDILSDHLGRVAQMVRDVTEAERHQEPAERLGAIVASLLAAYARADAKHKVQLNELQRLRSAQREAIQTLEREIVRLVAATLAQINPRLAEQRGLLAPVTMSLFGILNWHYTWFREDGPLSRADYARLATRLFLDGARAI